MRAPASSAIRVKGVDKLHGARHRINPDRIEAGTFLVAGAISGGDLVREPIASLRIFPLVAKLRGMRGRVSIIEG